MSFYKHIIQCNKEEGKKEQVPSWLTYYFLIAILLGLCLSRTTYLKKEYVASYHLSRFNHQLYSKLGGGLSCLVVIKVGG